MSLREDKDKIIKFVNSHKNFLEYNAKIQRAREGDMQSVMCEFFANNLHLPQNIADATRFCVSFNYLKFINARESQVFTFEPIYKASSHQELVDQYVKLLGLNAVFQLGNEYSNASKSQIFQLYQKRNGDPGARAIDNSVFIPYSDDDIEPDEPTAIVLIIKEFEKEGKDNHGNKFTFKCHKLHIYTDTEFLAVDSDGEIDEYKTSIENNGVNPLGFMPFVYVNYTENRLLPIVDKDILQNNIIINTYYTESKISNHYMANPIRYGRNIDKDMSTINFSPYKFTILNPPEGSDLQPEIAELATTLSHTESIAIIEKMEKTLSTLAGVNLSGFNGDGGASTASGDALQMLDQSILENRKRQITIYKPKIDEFFKKLAMFHNKLMSFKIKGPNLPNGIFPEGFNVDTIFPTPDTSASQKNASQNDAEKENKKVEEDDSADITSGDKQSNDDSVPPEKKE